MGGFLSKTYSITFPFTSCADEITDSVYIYSLYKDEEFAYVIAGTIWEHNIFYVLIGIMTTRYIVGYINSWYWMGWFKNKSAASKMRFKPNTWWKIPPFILWELFLSILIFLDAPLMIEKLAQIWNCFWDFLCCREKTEEKIS